MEQANQRLRELDASKSQFLSTVSHELRTPLTSIKAYAEILLDSPHPDPEMRRRFLGIIDKESDRLTRLISDLLDLAKIESGAVNWRIADTDLRRIVDQAAVSLASLAEEKAIQLRVLECAPMPVKVDADRIQQVVTI